MRGKIKDYEINYNQYNDLQLVIMFETEEGKTLPYWGSLKSDASKKYQLDQLKRLGFKGDKIDPNLANGPMSGLLDCETMFDLTPEEKTGKDGKTYQVVKWINDGEKKRLSPDDVAKALGRITDDIAF